MKLSLNQATVKRLTLAEAAEGCVRAGIPAIGLWRDRVQEIGIEAAAKIVRASGLEVTSLCRGGFMTAASAADRAAALADNKQAVLEAAGVGTDVLILVVGGLPSGSKDLPAARGAVAEGVADLVPFAAEHGVKLAIEPLHPMFCADRAVVSTLGQALDIAEAFPAEQVGVVVDTYHVWWDPQLEASIARAGKGNRILSYQECDWVVPLPADMLLGRGHVGDGHIDFARMRSLVTAAGWTGYAEVEIFNQEIWDADGDRTIATVRSRHEAVSAASGL
ncbi:Xylose isomerase domain protein TIM barrel [Catenulispora acidiphila DSM 44928]|uniref:Xylose isomerase domain protein TIM barrel n=1 Tax=Catenulispora acidiphila (strain DSM 44928 / JCM 14897 / NBRC 102108 / NRRL B-24433 / ID139908) TaxID=479433 RepID=C7QHF3_CATAD|nr:sugar phosphate isomerase/epimerase [Catenulispora acidiphila]ACU69092.1 Xylose isomerase domain protein TIM barrel [Catenulispora acidiphila DSM 44928]